MGLNTHNQITLPAEVFLVRRLENEYKQSMRAILAATIILTVSYSGLAVESVNLTSTDTTQIIFDASGPGLNSTVPQDSGEFGNTSDNSMFTLQTVPEPSAFVFVAMAIGSFLITRKFVKSKANKGI